jgi:putative pyruvate formate lyase activating enzyme
VDRSLYKGACGTLDTVRIAKYYLHKFEEPEISGVNGSGTVFFCGCSLKCVFCKNYELSRNTRGKIITPSNLVEIFKELEERGANNINLVTPSHYTNEIIKAFEIYTPKIPVVYNTHGYEDIETLKKIDKYISVYLPDLKFFSKEVSKRYTGLSDYFDVASKAVKFMMQSKKTVIENGIIKSGVIVRHLILPLSANDSVEIIKWFSENKENNPYFSLMAQYTPFGNIDNYPELKRKITKKEYQRALNAIENYNITDCFIQDLTSSKEEYIPSWDF